jgi:flagellar motility protein MotE (MotC chaperone)
MKPNAVANFMNQTDTNVAVEVFLNMKGEIAGGILSYMEPSKAAVITQRLMSSRSRQASATSTAQEQ